MRRQTPRPGSSAPRCAGPCPLPVGWELGTQSAEHTSARSTTRGPGVGGVPVDLFSCRVEVGPADADEDVAQCLCDSSFTSHSSACPR
jgi:hypothetical protein